MSRQLDQVLKKQQEQQHNLIDNGQSADEEIIQLVGFIVGDEEYAIPILSIQEIIKPIEYTRIPKR
jgi:purine-binding chemotaxis protein CheW